LEVLISRVCSAFSNFKDQGNLGRVELVQLRKNKILKTAFLVVVLVITVFLIIACSSQSSSNHQPPLKNKGSLHTKGTNTPSKWKFPISILQGKFFKVGGWLSDEELVYITNNEQTSTLYSYHLSSGRSTPLFNSEYPIESVQISPTKKNILVRSAPSSYEGKITIIDLKGKEIYSQTFPSYELVFEWNPYQDSQILVSSFQEDWSFKVFLVDFEQKLTKELSLPQPFLKWIDKDRYIYLNWDNTQEKLFAPLMTRSLEDASEHTLFPNVYQFSAFKNVIMTITVNSKEESKAIYSFYDQKLNLTFEFSMPQLTKFSDWLVPFYDYNEPNRQFITLRPLKSTEADTYTKGFQLVSYNLKKQKSDVLLKGLENEPIALSPSGNECLYGNRFEKMIDLRSKRIMNIVKE
jgi:hypothetical protein